MDPLTLTLNILGACIAASFFAGLATRNYSHVDRLWSVLPPVYVLVWLPGYLDNPRYLVAAALVVLWGVRLTANFAVKGGYRFSFRRGFYEEDYRWAVLRERIPNRVLFEIFNLTFISFYQLALVFAFTLPLYFYGKVEGPIGAGEVALFVIHGLLLLVETVADLQQLRYYRRREDPASKENPRIALGFNTFGLWKHSRHPNYAAEIAQWAVVYLYLHVATGRFHWSGIGAGLLALLFVGSTIMAERITASKYPAYADWKKATPPWVPFLDAPLRAARRRAFKERYHLSDF